MKYKVNIRLLRGLFNQMLHAYRACIQACDNGDHKHAVALQLQAVESCKLFEEQLLKELDRMRKQPRQTWAP